MSRSSFVATSSSALAANSLAKSIASSSASLVPLPIEKCAVCAASPINTTGTPTLPTACGSLPPERAGLARGGPSLRPGTLILCTQVLQTTRGKRIQLAEPRKCWALLISALPSRYFENRRSQNATPSAWLMPSRPCAFQTASGVSTMKVEVSASNLYACA